MSFQALVKEWYTMHHGENVKEVEDPQVVAWNRKLGLWLFAIYALVYASYVLVNTFAPQWMDQKILFGVNNAILAGFGLILAAIVIAFVYGFACRNSQTTGSSLEGKGTNK